jgi:hypothetical protein
MLRHSVEKICGKWPLRRLRKSLKWKDKNKMNLRKINYKAGSPHSSAFFIPREGVPSNPSTEG